MKSKRIKTSIGYSSKPDEFVSVWDQLLPYIQSYPYEIDKIIWVFEIEEGDISIFPGSPEDAEDPDIPLAFQFRIHDLWDGESDDISEDDKAFKKAYDKRKKWLVKSINFSWKSFANRSRLNAEGINGKLGVYLAEFFARLSPPALTYVCGAKLDFSVNDTDKLIDNFCKKYDMGRKYTVPTIPGKRTMIYLDGEMDSTSFVPDLIELLEALPDRRMIYLGHYNNDDLPVAKRNSITKSTGIPVKWMTQSKENAFLCAVDGL